MKLPREPDDAALLELGRLTWAAMNLEDVAYEMRRSLGPAPSNLVGFQNSVVAADLGFLGCSY